LCGTRSVTQTPKGWSSGWHRAPLTCHLAYVTMWVAGGRPYQGSGSVVGAHMAGAGRHTIEIQSKGDADATVTIHTTRSLPSEVPHDHHWRDPRRYVHVRRVRVRAGK